ncbi:uncharacterized protein SEPMUDRAFT_122510, partial [Sphaerulina musiva SO2202]
MAWPGLQHIYRSSQRAGDLARRITMRRVWPIFIHDSHCIVRCEHFLGTASLHAHRPRNVSTFIHTRLAAMAGPLSDPRVPTKKQRKHCIHIHPATIAALREAEEGRARHWTKERMPPWAWN